MNPYLIAGVTVVYFVAGILANQYGITVDVVTFALVDPDNPNSGGGFLALLAPLVWVFNTIGSVFQLITFQANIPAYAKAIITLPVGIVVFIMAVKVIRGS